MRYEAYSSQWFPPRLNRPLQPPRRRPSTDPANQCIRGKTAVVSASDVLLLTGCSAVVRCGCRCASDTAVRSSQRRYSPKANAITKHTQNRNKPSNDLTSPSAISQPPTAKPALTKPRLNRKDSARAHIAQIKPLPLKPAEHGRSSTSIPSKASAKSFGPRQSRPERRHSSAYALRAFCPAPVWI